MSGSFGRATLAAALLFSSVLMADRATAQQATHYQIDRAHTGSVKMAVPLSMPFRMLWSANLHGTVSYPLIADGRVFAYVLGGKHNSLRAFDARTGDPLWTEHLPRAMGAVYGQGLVFVLGDDGRLRAFDAATGHVMWSRALKGEYVFNEIPVYSNGAVYVNAAGQDGILFAFNAADGTPTWSHPSRGAMPSLAADDKAIYGVYGCDHTDAWDPATGAALWSRQGSFTCSADAQMTVLDGDRGLYAFDSVSGNLVLNPATGAAVGSFVSQKTPAIGDGVGYFQEGYALKARVLATQELLWSWSPPWGSLISGAPLVIDGHVVLSLTNGVLTTLSRKDGHQTWSFQQRSAPVDHDTMGIPRTGMAAGEGILAVPTSTRLTVYGN